MPIIYTKITWYFGGVVFFVLLGTVKMEMSHNIVKFSGSMLGPYDFRIC